jgi:hypothetical protein
LEENEMKPAEASSPENSQSLGDDILKMLGERTQNPGEAFVLLQQLSIFIWDQYKVDWNEREGVPAAGGRKQRCLNYISQLMDAFKSDEPAA